MSYLDYLRHEYYNDNLAFIWDFDGTIVPKGKPAPCEYTRAVVNIIKENLVINTARWGPTCVRHFLGHDIKVIGAQGMELNLSPDKSGEVWGEPDPICSEMLRSLHQIKKSHKELRINTRMHNDKPVALFINWFTHPNPGLVHDEVISLLEKHSGRENYYHRHIINKDLHDAEVVPKSIDKKGAVAHALHDRKLFEGKKILAAGDTPDTDGPVLEYLKECGHIIAFVGDKPYNAHLRFTTPFDFISFAGRIIGLNPPGLTAIQSWRIPPRIGNNFMIPVHS